MPPLPEVPGVRHRDVQVAGLRFHVAEAGDGAGEPLVLLHGWPQHWWMWRHVVGQLAAGRRVVCPDLRGHGWTEAPSDGYDKRRLADDLLALLDALGLDRVGLVGHDWGAWAGMLAALKAPDRFSGLLALSIPHLWPSGRDRLAVRRSLAMLAYQGPLSTPVVGERLVRRGFARAILQAGRSQGRFTEQELAVYDDVLRAPERARATVALYRAFLLREVPALAAGTYASARLRVPTRLVVGGDDAVVRHSRLDGHEGHAEHMTIDRVPGVGHFLPEERPDAVLDHAGALFG